MRQLGIPTVVDRLVQQGILQVLDPLLDPTFSESTGATVSVPGETTQPSQATVSVPGETPTRRRST